MYGILWRGGGAGNLTLKNKTSFMVGRRSVGQTLISFKNPEGQQDIAMFRLPKLFFVNGRRIQQKEHKIVVN